MNKAFTLIELMIIVVIIAILSAIIVPTVLRARNAEKVKIESTLYKPTVPVLPESPKPDVRIKQRFKYMESGAIGDKGQHPIYIVKDEQTNRSYLMIVGAGITEMNTDKQQE